MEIEMIELKTNPYRVPKLAIDTNGNWTSDIPTEGGIDPKYGAFLRFSEANAKLKALRKASAVELGIPVARVKLWTLTLPAGWSCPSALECKAFADPITGRIWDSPTLKFRCFAASAEARPSVRNVIWHNFNLLRRLEQLKDPAMDRPVSHYVTKRDRYQDLITDSIYNAMERFKIRTDDVVIIRVHVGGDFFSKSYLLGWADSLRELDYVKEQSIDMPRVIGYAYSKSIRHIEKLGLDSMPKNFVLTASRGGTDDELIDRIGLKESVVVGSPEQAESEGLEIDHDDSHALFGQESFGLLIHGTQPKGTESAKALSALKARGIDSGYSN